MSVETFIPASDKQVGFLKSLLSERKVDAEYVVNMQAMIEAGAVSKSKASDEIGFLLKQAKAPKAVPLVEPGYYFSEADEAVYEIVKAKSTGNLYAKVLVPPKGGKKKGSWVYAPGAMKESATWNLLSAEDAAALGKKWGMCAICGATLTDDTNKGPDGLTSLQRGIGPVCAAKL